MTEPNAHTQLQLFTGKQDIAQMTRLTTRCPVTSDVRLAALAQIDFG